MTETVVSHPAEKLVGQVLFTYEMPIERGKIREFARATGATDSEYQAVDAPIPPTFLASAMAWEPADPPLVDLLGLRLENVLQGGQEYRFSGPWITAGETLTADVSVESLTTKQGKRGGSMVFIVILTRFTRPDGQVAAEGRATVIEKAAP